MYQLIFKPRAIKMQADAYTWYEKEKVGLGELFLKELDVNYNKLCLHPLSYSKTGENYKHIILKKFPFVIAFSLIKNTVVVYAVFHTSRHPKKKFKG